MILTYIMFFLLGMVAQVLLDKLGERLKKELEREKDMRNDN